MYAGRPVELSSRGAMALAPRHPYSDMLADAVPELRVGWLDGVRHRQTAEPAPAGALLAELESCAFYGRCDGLRLAGTCDTQPTPWRPLSKGAAIRCCRTEAELSALQAAAAPLAAVSHHASRNSHEFNHPDGRETRNPALDPLLQPLRIKKLLLRNRIMSTSHASTLDVGGMPLERYLRYHEEKARGGIALTMFGGSSMVSPDSSWGGGQINVSTDEIIPHLQAILHAHPWAPARPSCARSPISAGARPPPPPTGCRPWRRRASARPGIATSARDGPPRYRPHHPRLRRSRLALPRRRAGRGGDGDRRPPDRAVPVAVAPICAPTHSAAPPRTARASA